ncbi:MAG: hypothetical protein HYT82_00500 [Candidatus Harrisonbacteria bacterium]|nr:hypothetical protein [Candidatus Harrisonbacteria bacterium]
MICGGKVTVVGGLKMEMEESGRACGERECPKEVRGALEAHVDEMNKKNLAGEISRQRGEYPHGKYFACSHHGDIANWRTFGVLVAALVGFPLLLVLLLNVLYVNWKAFVASHEWIVATVALPLFVLATCLVLFVCGELADKRFARWSFRWKCRECRKRYGEYRREVRIGVLRDILDRWNKADWRNFDDIAYMYHIRAIQNEIAGGVPGFVAYVDAEDGVKWGLCYSPPEKKA